METAIAIADSADADAGCSQWSKPVIRAVELNGFTVYIFILRLRNETLLQDDIFIVANFYSWYSSCKLDSAIFLSKFSSLNRRTYLAA